MFNRKPFWLALLIACGLIAFFTVDAPPRVLVDLTQLAVNASAKVIQSTQAVVSPGGGDLSGEGIVTEGTATDAPNKGNNSSPVDSGRSDGADSRDSSQPIDPDEGSEIPNYPPSLSSYQHPSSACAGKNKIPEVKFSDSVFFNGTNTWPTLPDVRLRGETEHERCHYIMKRQLQILAAVMKHLNLTQYWFISHGSLLGAVRHGGFIPWDVDVDVVMPRSYMTKLRQEWRKLFPRDMFLQTEKTEPNFHMWVGKERAIRVKDRYSTFQGMKYTFWSKGKKYKQKKWHLGAHIDIIPLQRMGQGRFKLLHHFINYSYMFPTQQICFEDVMVPAPANVTWMLEYLYGKKYMAPPANVTFGGPTVLPCKATLPSAGTGWSLSWEEDYVNGSIKTSPRGDPAGSYNDDRRKPFA